VKETVSKKLVKSAERVRDLGEVFTPDFLVEQMLDQFPQDAWLPHKNWLEPTCGNGQFILGVLRRKIAANLISMKPFAALTMALDTTFGTDIMQDNVSECRVRIYEEIVIPFWREHGIYGDRRLNQRWQVVSLVMNNIRKTKDALKEDYTKFQHVGHMNEREQKNYFDAVKDLLEWVDLGHEPVGLNRAFKRVYKELQSLRHK
jgi:hypothetical protein